MESGFWTASTDGSQAERIVPIGAGDSSMRMNDGKCDVFGRLWAGTMPYDDRSGVAGLYRLDGDRTLRQMLTGVSLSNGLGWSPDNRFMYYVDTPTRRVDVFDFDVVSGELSNRRALFEVPAGRGVPDGLTVDADGCIWLALWGGGAILRFTPDGRVDSEVRLPVTRVTSCTFGGRTLDELYITTASIELSQSELANQPYAGAIFVCRPGIDGVPGNSWAG
jgi:sugar lactone lactonase YvrE